MRNSVVSAAAFIFILAGCGAQAPRIELQAPATIAGGSGFQVRWVGPDNVGDYITIVPAGAPEGDWAEYSYTAAGNPVTLHAPYAPGQYEIRYATEKTDPDSTLGRVTISVTAVEVSVTAPEAVDAGVSFEVSWTGPANPDCYVYLVPEGAPEGDWAGSEWYYVSTGNPLTFSAPMRAPAGSYEVRFATETTEPDSTLAKATVVINGADGVVLHAPADVTAGSSFDVTWTGATAAGEYVIVVPSGTPEGEWAGWEWHYVSDAGTLNFTAPDVPGDYEIRFATEATNPNTTITRIPLTVD